MTVSKRLRFEILRRDNHQCRYCGASAPDVALTVDHVTPVALGGTDDPTNLVAACGDCNAGKSSASPDQRLVEDIDQDAMRWSRAMRVAIDESLGAKKERDLYIGAFLNTWSTFDPMLDHLPSDHDGMLTYWHRIGVPEEIVTEAVFTAFGKRHIPASATFRYTIGIIRNQIAEIEQRARHLLASEEAPDGP